MKIELATPNTLKITWPAYDASTEAEIVRRLGTVPGIEGRGRRWYAPIIQTARLTELFPKASFDYAVLQASDGVARTFYDSLVYLGINFDFDDSGATVGLGEGVSPLIQQLVHERRHALKPFVEEAMVNPKPKPQPQPPAGPVLGPVTSEDAGWQRVLTVARNAAAKEELERVKYPKRRRKAKKEKV